MKFTTRFLEYYWQRSCCAVHLIARFVFKLKHISHNIECGPLRRVHLSRHSWTISPATYGVKSGPLSQIAGGQEAFFHNILPGIISRAARFEIHLQTPIICRVFPIKITTRLLIKIFMCSKFSRIKFIYVLSVPIWNDPGGLLLEHPPGHHLSCRPVQINPVLSHTISWLNSFWMSTPPHNRQIIALISHSKQNLN